VHVGVDWHGAFRAQVQRYQGLWNEEGILSVEPAEKIFDDRPIAGRVTAASAETGNS
jgi:hypothetical protein